MWSDGFICPNDVIPNSLWVTYCEIVTCESHVTILQLDIFGYAKEGISGRGAAW